jgi:hypothetical protein
MATTAATDTMTARTYAQTGDKILLLPGKFLDAI